MDTIWLWVWYIIVVVIVWIILAAKFSVGMPMGMAFLCATILGLVVGLFLIPWYKQPNMCSEDELSLSIFIWVTALLPLVALIWVILSGEYRRFWDHGKGNCFTSAEIQCNEDGCKLTHMKKKCADGEVTIHNHSEE